MRCAADGQSVKVTDHRLGELELGPYGETKVCKCGPPTPALLVKVVPLVDDDGMTFGLLISTNRGSMFVYNWGDELQVALALPSHVRETLSSPLPE